MTYRLETEEQARQKLQLEKVAVDGKLKKLEESVALHEDSNNKVRISCNISLKCEFFYHSLVSVCCQKLIPYTFSADTLLWFLVFLPVVQRYLIIGATVSCQSLCHNVCMNLGVWVCMLA